MLSVGSPSLRRVYLIQMMTVGIEADGLSQSQVPSQWMKVRMLGVLLCGRTCPSMLFTHHVSCAGQPSHLSILSDLTFSTLSWGSPFSMAEDV